MSDRKHSGKFYLLKARQHGLVVKNGKGDHCKIYGPAGRGYMVVPLHRELSKGVECAIKKWFKAAGIILSLIIGLIWIIL